MKTTANIIAKSAVVSALTVALLAIGNTIRFVDLAFNVFAGILLWCFVIEYGSKRAIAPYIVASIIAIVLLPYKFTAVTYAVVFGLYSILKQPLDRIRPAPLRWVIKLAIVAFCVSAVNLFYIFVFINHTFSSPIMLALLILGAWVAFFIYDTMLNRVADLYKSRFRFILQ